MSAKLTWQGMSEFRRDLRNLPEDLANEASVIILAHADDAQRQIQDAYPEGPTGNLKSRVRREINRTKFTTGAIIKSAARHAHLFEFGTRKRTTDKGADRGSMPQGQETQRMIPIAIRTRRRMVGAIITVLEKIGFEVRQ